MTRDQCAGCVYEPRCFPVLKYWMRLSSDKCKQSRQRNKERGYRDIPRTSNDLEAETEAINRLDRS